MHRNKRHHHSITASARAGRPYSITRSARSKWGQDGKVQALRRLQIDDEKNRVGCSTGISPGFAPFRPYQLAPSPDEKLPSGWSDKPPNRLRRLFPATEISWADQCLPQT